MAITIDPYRVWRIEAFREAGSVNSMTVHVERVIKEDGVQLDTLRKESVASAGAPVGNPTDPANYPSADGGLPVSVTRSIADITALPDTIDVGAHTGITTTEALQIMEALSTLLVDNEVTARREAAKQAAADAAS